MKQITNNVARLSLGALAALALGLSARLAPAQNLAAPQLGTALNGTGNAVGTINANLVTPNIGAATGTSLTTSGNVSAANSMVSATGTFYANGRSEIQFPSTNAIRLLNSAQSYYDDITIASQNAIALDGALALGTGANAPSAITLSPGVLAMPVVAASGTAPGAAGAKLELVCSATAGKARLQVYAGTSTTPVTILDGIGAGVTGC